MLTIQPGLVNNFSRSQAFGNRNFQRYAQDVDFVDYEDVTDLYGDNASDRYDFDINREKEKTKKELDLWKQTKANVDAIAKSTENVPGVKTGTKILSGLTAVAIGWGGLRWGTVGTLEVLSKMGKSDAAQAVKGFAENSGKWISKQADSLKKYAQRTDVYKSAAKRISGWEKSFADSSVGKTLDGWKKAINDNSAYKAVVKAKDNTVDYLRKVNYKRVFVEGMGVAGGGTAAVNVLGGKTIDGRKQNVEVDNDGKYYVNGREYMFDEGDVSDAA